MAGADYYLCDICSRKTFYDSDVDYELADIGKMIVMCIDCARKHEVTITKILPDSD